MYQFADGFDTYGTAYSLLAGYPWDQIVGACQVITTDYRFAPPAGIPGGCVSIPQNGSIRKNLVGNPSTIIKGFGFKLSTLPASGVAEICTLWDSGAFQISLVVTANGALQFWRGNGLPPGGGGVYNSAQIGTTTAAGTIAAATWYGILFQATINATTGSLLLYLNGGVNPLINSTGLNTRGSANSYATQSSLGNITNNITTSKFDDYFCFDTTGSSQNTIPTVDVRIFTKLASGVGAYSNWTPTGLASNYQNVSQAPPSTSDYNANNVGGTKDSYALPAIGITSVPIFVVARASVEKDDGATHTPSLMVRNAGVDSVGTALSPITSSYLFYDTLFQNDPNTGNPWTGTGVDSAQVGIVEG